MGVVTAAVVVVGATVVAIDRSTRHRMAGHHSECPGPLGEPRPPNGVNVVADNKHWHTPISTRPVCPVCKKAVYSRGGIHPQCAVIQAEAPRADKKTPQAPGRGS